MINVLVGTVMALTVSAVFILVLWIGFCVIIGFTKHRQSGPKTLILRSLDEVAGHRQTYFAPDAPRGPVDQLAGAKRT